MEIQLTARHFKASQKLQEVLREEMLRLQKFYERITGCRVVLDAVKKGQREVEITLNVAGSHLVAKSNAENMGKAIAKTLNKIEKQLKKAKQKKRDHFVRAGKYTPAFNFGAMDLESEEG